MIFSLFPAYPRSDIYRCVSGLSRIFIDPRSLCSLCLPTRLDRKADMDRSGTLETRKRTLLACRLHPSRMKSALVSRISRLKNPLRASITTAFIPSIPLSFVSLRHIFFICPTTLSRCSPRNGEGSSREISTIKIVPTLGF